MENKIERFILEDEYLISDLEDSPYTYCLTQEEAVELLNKFDNEVKMLRKRNKSLTNKFERVVERLKKLEIENEKLKNKIIKK